MPRLEVARQELLGQSGHLRPLGHDLIRGARLEPVLHRLERLARVPVDEALLAEQFAGERQRLVGDHAGVPAGGHHTRVEERLLRRHGGAVEEIPGDALRLCQQVRPDAHPRRVAVLDLALELDDAAQGGRLGVDDTAVDEAEHLHADLVLRAGEDRWIGGRGHVGADAVEPLAGAHREPVEDRRRRGARGREDRRPRAVCAQNLNLGRRDDPPSAPIVGGVHAARRLLEAVRLPGPQHDGAIGLRVDGRRMPCGVLPDAPIGADASLVHRPVDVPGFAPKGPRHGRVAAGVRAEPRERDGLGLPVQRLPLGAGHVMDRSRRLIARSPQLLGEGIELGLHAREDLVIEGRHRAQDARRRGHEVGRHDRLADGRRVGLVPDEVGERQALAVRQRGELPDDHRVARPPHERLDRREVVLVDRDPDRLDVVGVLTGEELGVEVEPGEVVPCGCRVLLGHLEPGGPREAVQRPVSRALEDAGALLRPPDELRGEVFLAAHGLRGPVRRVGHHVLDRGPRVQTLRRAQLALRERLSELLHTERAPQVRVEARQSLGALDHVPDVARRVRDRGVTELRELERDRARDEVRAASPHPARVPNLADHLVPRASDLGADVKERRVELVQVVERLLGHHLAPGLLGHLLIEPRPPGGRLPDPHLLGERRDRVARVAQEVVDGRELELEPLARHGIGAEAALLGVGDLPELASDRGARCLGLGDPLAGRLPGCRLPGDVVVRLLPELVGRQSGEVRGVGRRLVDEELTEAVDRVGRAALAREVLPRPDRLLVRAEGIGVVAHRSRGVGSQDRIVAGRRPDRVLLRGRVPLRLSPGDHRLDRGPGDGADRRVRDEPLPRLAQCGVVPDEPVDPAAPGIRVERHHAVGGGHRVEASAQVRDARRGDELDVARRRVEFPAQRVGPPVGEAVVGGVRGHPVGVGRPDVLVVVPGVVVEPGGDLGRVVLERVLDLGLVGREDRGGAGHGIGMLGDEQEPLVAGQLRVEHPVRRQPDHLVERLAPRPVVPVEDRLGDRPIRLADRALEAGVVHPGDRVEHDRVVRVVAHEPLAQYLADHDVRAAGQGAEHALAQQAEPLERVDREAGHELDLGIVGVGRRAHEVVGPLDCRLVALHPRHGVHAGRDRRRAEAGRPRCRLELRGSTHDPCRAR